MESKFKVGDKVRVLPKQEGKSYDAGYVSGMTKFSGVETTVKCVRTLHDYVAYELDECGDWDWSEDMLELANEPVKESANGFSIYLMTGRVPGFPINTIVRVNDDEPGCYVHNQYYTPDDILSFAVVNASQLFELIHKR